MIFFKRLFFKLLRKSPADMEMVKYWKTGDTVRAKLIEQDGVVNMKMEGEKYIFPGFPRGQVLFGKLSKLKHEIKNQIFNDSWAMLNDKTPEEINAYIKETWDKVLVHFDDMKLDMLPPQRMVPSVRNIHRAWKKTNPQSKLADAICLILHEDDAYRFRFQWMFNFMPPFWLVPPHKAIMTGLKWAETAEVVGDMKERVRLVRTILEIMLQDKENRRQFNKVMRSLKRNLVRMNKVDKYFFRAKYFKVDLDLFEY